MFYAKSSNVFNSWYGKIRGGKPLVASNYNLEHSLTLMKLKTYGMVENRVNSTNPVVRHVNASCRETCMGPYGPPSGGFCVSLQITYYRRLEVYYV